LTLLTFGRAQSNRLQHFQGQNREARAGID
jgi:hypothetical protein